MSDFKSETSFGFFNPNYTGHDFYIFLQNQKNELVHMANFPVLKKVFSRGVLVTILAIELEIDVLLSRNLLSYVRYEPKTSLCLQMFNCSPKNGCFILAITCTRENCIIEDTQTSLTSLNN